MSDQMTLRDQLAMSMDPSSIPTFYEQEDIDSVFKEFDLEQGEDIVSRIEAALQFRAIIRYKYADAMLKTRSKKI